jgi:hypothetical protein
MYTVEDINKAKQYLSDNGYGTGSNFTLNTVANLMAEWAAKNCSIPAINNLACQHQKRLWIPELNKDLCLNCGTLI